MCIRDRLRVVRRPIRLHRRRRDVIVPIVQWITVRALSKVFLPRRRVPDVGRARERRHLRRHRTPPRPKPPVVSRRFASSRRSSTARDVRPRAPRASSRSRSSPLSSPLASRIDPSPNGRAVIHSFIHHSSIHPTDRSIDRSIDGPRGRTAPIDRSRPTNDPTDRSIDETRLANDPLDRHPRLAAPAPSSRDFTRRWRCGR